MIHELIILKEKVKTWRGWKRQIGLLFVVYFFVILTFFNSHVEKNRKKEIYYPDAKLISPYFKGFKIMHFEGVYYSYRFFLRGFDYLRATHSGYLYFETNKNVEELKLSLKQIPERDLPRDPFLFTRGYKNFNFIYYKKFLYGIDKRYSAKEAKKLKGKYFLATTAEELTEKIDSALN